MNFALLFKNAYQTKEDNEELGMTLGPQHKTYKDVTKLFTCHRQ